MLVNVKSVQQWALGISRLHVILESTFLDVLSIDFSECGTIGGGACIVLYKGNRRKRPKYST